MPFHVLILEHILFFSISFSSYNLTKSDLIHIDPFFDDQDSLSPITNTIDISTLIPNAPSTSSFPMAPQAPP